MGYVVEVDGPVAEQLVDLPAQALPLLAEVMALLEVDPWSGDSHVADPAAPMRTVVVGRHGERIALYLVVERQAWVLVVQVTWFG